MLKVKLIEALTIFRRPDYSRPKLNSILTRVPSLVRLGAVLIQQDDQGREYHCGRIWASRSCNRAKQIHCSYQRACLDGVWAVELPGVSVWTALYVCDRPQISDVVDDKLSGNPWDARLMDEFAPRVRYHIYFARGVNFHLN